MFNTVAIVACLKGSLALGGGASRRGSAMLTDGAGGAAVGIATH